MTKSLSIIGNIKRLDGSTEIMSDSLSVSENYTEVSVQEITIAAAGTDVALNLNGVTTAQLVILVPTYASSSTEYFTMKIDGGSESIKFGKMAVLGGKGANGITALTVTNPDASNPFQLKVYLA